MLEENRKDALDLEATMYETSNYNYRSIRNEPSFSNFQVFSSLHRWPRLRLGKGED